MSSLCYYKNLYLYFCGICHQHAVFPVCSAVDVIIRVCLGLIQCVGLQELPSPAGGAALTAGLEPERHLLVTDISPAGAVTSGEARL